MSMVQLWLLFGIAVPILIAFRLAGLNRGLIPAGNGATPVGLAEGSMTVRGFAAETLEVEAVLASAAGAARDAARVGFVRLELAVEGGLRAHIDATALRDAVRAMLLTAIQSAPGGQVLITAMALDNQLHIRITDDGNWADQRTRECQARGAEELIALQGGSIAIDTRPNRGTTITMRLPLPSGLNVRPEDLHWTGDLAGQEA